MESRQNRKLLEGVVVSNKMEKTVVVKGFKKNSECKISKVGRTLEAILCP